jgi:hypothetical protein
MRKISRNLRRRGVRCAKPPHRRALAAPPTSDAPRTSPALARPRAGLTASALCLAPRTSPALARPRAGLTASALCLAPRTSPPLARPRAGLTASALCLAPRTSPALARPRAGLTASALCLLAFAAAPAACDQSPESNGGPRVAALRSERAPYPSVTDLPSSTRGITASAEHFVLVGGDEIVQLGRRGAATTTEVSVDELLRAFWRQRGDPLGGRGAATTSSAPLVLAGATVPAERVIEVVAAMWQHGAYLAVGGGALGGARAHPVLMMGEDRSARGAIVEIGPRGLELTLPGEEARQFDDCGAAPSTACLARALDRAAESGARSVLVRRARQAAGAHTRMLRQ